MKWKTEVKLYSIMMSMSLCILSLILGGISRPEGWLDISFVMFIIGLILLPFIYIVVYNTLPKNPDGGVGD